MWRQCSNGPSRSIVARILLQPEPPACGQQPQGLPETPSPRRGSSGRADPGDVRPPIGWSQPLEMRPGRRPALQRPLDIERDPRDRRAWRIAAPKRRPALQSRGREQPAPLEIGIPPSIRRRPLAVRLPRRELPGVARLVDAPDEAVDPAEAQRFLDRIVVRERRRAGQPLAEDEPDRGLGGVVGAQPSPPGRAGPDFNRLERLRRHRSMSFSARYANSSRSRILRAME